MVLPEIRREPQEKGPEPEVAWEAPVFPRVEDFLEWNEEAMKTKLAQGEIEMKPVELNLDCVWKNLEESIPESNAGLGSPLPFKNGAVDAAENDIVLAKECKDSKWIEIMLRVFQLVRRVTPQQDWVQIYPREKSFDSHIFFVRLFAQGKWRAIPVTDEVPVNPEGSILLPCSVASTGDGDQIKLWPLLLSKALLVIHSSTQAENQPDSLLYSILSFPSLPLLETDTSNSIVVAGELAHFAVLSAPDQDLQLVQLTRANNAPSNEEKENPVTINPLWPKANSRSITENDTIVCSWKLVQPKTEVKSFTEKPETSDLWPFEFRSLTGHLLSVEAKGHVILAVETLAPLKKESKLSLTIVHVDWSLDVSQELDSYSSASGVIVLQLLPKNNVTTLYKIFISCEYGYTLRAFSVSTSKDAALFKLEGLLSQKGHELYQPTFNLAFAQRFFTEQKRVLKGSWICPMRFLLQIKPNEQLRISANFTIIADSSIKRSLTCEVVNNDTGSSTLYGDQRLPPTKFKGNQSGYTLLIHGFVPFDTPRFKIMAQILAETMPVNVKLLDAESYSIFQGEYERNYDQILLREIVGTDEANPIAAHVTALPAADETEDIIVTVEKTGSQGKQLVWASKSEAGQVIVPSVFLEKGQTFVIQARFNPDCHRPLSAPCKWRLKLVSNSNMRLSKDRTRDEAFETIKKQWESSDPGRAQRAKQTRKAFLENQAKSEDESHTEPQGDDCVRVTSELLQTMKLSVTAQVQQGIELQRKNRGHRAEEVKSMLEEIKSLLDSNALRTEQYASSMLMHWEAREGYRKNIEGFDRVLHALDEAIAAAIHAIQTAPPKEEVAPVKGKKPASSSTSTSLIDAHKDAILNALKTVESANLPQWKLLDALEAGSEVLRFVGYMEVKRVLIEQASKTVVEILENQAAQNPENVETVWKRLTEQPIDTAVIEKVKKDATALLELELHGEPKVPLKNECTSANILLAVNAYVALRNLFAQEQKNEDAISEELKAAGEKEKILIGEHHELPEFVSVLKQQCNQWLHEQETQKQSAEAN